MLEQLVTGVAAGQSRTLVIRGDQGIGKTALLDYLVDFASGCEIARATGVESEAELTYSGLHQLCRPFLGRISRLPRPQRDALGAAFGINDGAHADRFLIGLAVLSLLTETAKEKPLICVVDDLQWIDPASLRALAFVVGQLETDSIGIVFGVRRSVRVADLSELPELVLHGLGDREARMLLESALTGPHDERVLARVVAEARGNPRALLELPRGMTVAEIAGGLGFIHTPALTPVVRRRLRRRLMRLPRSTRLLLLIVAAEPALDPVLVWRAAELLDIGADAAGPGEVAELIEPGAQIRFRHPLTRSAVYLSASPSERQTVHAALAEVTDAVTDADRRAWHRAHAVAGLDEHVAAELEQSIERARSRGGAGTGAAFLKLAAECTPDPSRRARRALAAAQANRLIGAREVALRLLAMARSEPLEEPDRVRVDLLSAQLVDDSGRRRDAVPMLLNAARRVESIDVEAARLAYRDALAAALATGRLASRPGIREVADAAKAALSSDVYDPRYQLLLGLSKLLTEGHAAGEPLLSEALDGFCDEGFSRREGFRWLSLACRAAYAAGDDTSLFDLSNVLITSARSAGATTVLPVGLLYGAICAAAGGDLARARAMVDESATVDAAGPRRAASYGSLVVAAWEGRDADLEFLVRTLTADMTAHGEGEWLTATEWAKAVLYNGLGRYQDALIAADRASEQRDDLGWSIWSTAELIEAAVRTGTPERAHAVIGRLSEAAGSGGTDWLLGISARSHALLSEGDAAELLYLEAIKRLGRTRVRAELARSHLLYGEWLRRRHRRVDARSHLRIADETFTGMGFIAFAERARRELLATGETVRKRTDATRDELTPQEIEIARLAGEGCTNPEIGARLFISPRTVEWHLRKVFSKLGIASRKNLRDVLPQARNETPQDTRIRQGSDHWRHPLRAARSPDAYRASNSMA